MTEYTDRFQSEVMRLLGTAIQKIDGLEGRMNRLEQKTDVLTGQVTGIASKLIEIDKRLSVLEMRFDSLDHRLTSLETEVRLIRQEIADLHRKIDRNDAYREIIDELAVRVQKLEDKLVA